MTLEYCHIFKKWIAKHVFCFKLLWTMFRGKWKWGGWQVFVYLFLWNKVFLCSPSCLWTRFVNHAGLRFTEICLPLPLNHYYLRLSTTTTSKRFFSSIKFWFFMCVHYVIWLSLPFIIFLPPLLVPCPYNYLPSISYLWFCLGSHSV